MSSLASVYVNTNPIITIFMANEKRLLEKAASLLLSAV